MTVAALLERMRVCAKDDVAEFHYLVGEIYRMKLWECVDFRVANGITYLYFLLAFHASTVPDTVDVEAMCRAVATTHRNYVVYNESVHVFLFHMLSTPLRDPKAIAVLRGTLETTMVAFALFLKRRVCDDTVVAHIRQELRTHVFPRGASALRFLEDRDEKAAAVREEERADRTCPITLDVIADGVVASDGYLYERDAIITHMVTRRESPLTREYLDVDLVPWTRGET